MVSDTEYWIYPSKTTVEEKAFNVDQVKLGTPKLQEVIDKVKAKGWKMPENEKEICEYAVKEVHKEFGGYNKTYADNVNKMIEVRLQQEKIEASDKYTPKQKEEMLAGLEQRYDNAYNENFEIELRNNYLMDAGKMKHGDALCLPLSAITSYVLHESGVENSVVLSTAQNVKAGRPEMSHAYIVTNSGNIVDPSVASDPYKVNINGGDVSKPRGLFKHGNEVIITDDGCVYGFGDQKDGALQREYDKFQKKNNRADTQEMQDMEKYAAQFDDFKKSMNSTKVAELTPEQQLASKIAQTQDYSKPGGQNIDGRGFA